MKIIMFFNKNYLQRYYHTINGCLVVFLVIYHIVYNKLFNKVVCICLCELSIGDLSIIVRSRFINKKFRCFTINLLILEIFFKLK